MRRATDRQLRLAIHVLEQERIRLRLQAVRAAARTWIELIGCKVAHDFPIAIRMEQVAEARIADVPDVERLVLFIEEESAGSDQTVSRHLRDERWPEALGVVALTLIFHAVALYRNSEARVAHRLDLVEGIVERRVLCIIG